MIKKASDNNELIIKVNALFMVILVETLLLDYTIILCNLLYNVNIILGTMLDKNENNVALIIFFNFIKLVLKKLS